MGQNANRPARDTSALVHRQRQRDRRPQGQEEAYRAMEILTDDIVNPVKEGSDLYYELQDALAAGEEVDDEALGTEMTPENLRQWSATRPGVLNLINQWAAGDVRAGRPRQGFRANGETMYITNQDQLNEAIRQALSPAAPKRELGPLEQELIKRQQ
jgi:hypothetical protein